MKKTLGQLYPLLEAEEETIVLELLDLTSPELVNTYKYKVRQRHDYISKYYEDFPDNDESEETPYPRDEERFGPRGLGSKSVWEEAGFEEEDENF